MTIHEVDVGTEQRHWYTVVYDDGDEAKRITVNQANNDEGGSFAGLDAAAKVSALYQDYHADYQSWCGTPNPDQEPYVSFDGKRGDSAWAKLRAYVRLPEE